MKNLVFIGLLLMLFTNIKAQIYFENTGDYTLWVCAAYYDSREDSFISKGHYKVEPGATVQILANFRTSFFWHAKSKNGETLTGDYNLLIDPENAFTIHDADKNYQQDSNPNYLYCGFNRVVLSGIQSLGIHYTVKAGVWEENE